MSSWHEDDEFWERLAPIMFCEERLVAAPDEVESVLVLAGVEPGCRVLDMCCGPGRHAIEFARRGFQVTGVDRTAAYLDSARRASGEAGCQVDFIQQDAREFRRPESFELAVNLFTSFGYFEDPADDLRMARGLADALVPSGTLVMELMGKEVLARIFQPRSWEDRGGMVILEERWLRDDWSWIENRWITISDNETREFTLGHRLYSAAELKALLIQAGFSAVNAFGSLTGEPYDHTARRLVLVASR